MYDSLGTTSIYKRVGIFRVRVTPVTQNESWKYSGSTSSWHGGTKRVRAMTVCGQGTFTCTWLSHAAIPQKHAGLQAVATVQHTPDFPLYRWWPRAYTSHPPDLV